MEAEHVCQTGNLKVSRVILALKQDHAWPTNALLMENALRTCLPRMVPLADLKATSVPWVTLVPWEYVSREPSWNQELAVVMETAHLVTRQTHVMEAEHVSPTGNPKASHVTPALKWDHARLSNALTMELALKIFMPRMVLLVVRRATNAPWLTRALLVFVSRELSLPQEPVVEMETAPLVTRLICATEADNVFPIWNLKALPATPAIPVLLSSLRFSQQP
jgi:hypothetical protein